MNNKPLFAVAFLALLGAAGCSNRYALDNRGPDEYSVMSKPPLSLPPDFTLRAPEPRKSTLLSKDSQKKAEEVLTGKKSKTVQTDGLSAGEEALLGQSGKSDDNIRETLGTEAAQEDEDTLYLDKKIKKWKDQNGNPLDAAQEADALRQEGIPTTGKPSN